MKSYIKPFSVKLIFAWYDIWVGVFIDRSKKLIYFFPIPMLGFVFKYGYLRYNPNKVDGEL
jgi:hypothetical protein